MRVMVKVWMLKDEISILVTMNVAQKTDPSLVADISYFPVDFMSNMTHFKGNITFYSDQIKIKDIHGLNPTYTSNPSWDIGDSGKTLVFDGITPSVLHKDGGYYFPFQKLTFLKISTHLIELQDKHGDIIKLTR
jgi:hypothetical protein